MEAIVC